ncbi:hypothetical protein ACFO3J_28265 [Streptomyces polygonati]|uniref:Uncharacterized protein n=1 Tax=Streptomyces polygonati TaxID=1617087 RepID=A0ABV8HWN1_9ACTN
MCIIQASLAGPYGNGAERIACSSPGPTIVVFGPFAQLNAAFSSKIANAVAFEELQRFIPASVRTVESGTGPDRVAGLRTSSGYRPPRASEPRHRD